MKQACVKSKNSLAAAFIKAKKQIMNKPKILAVCDFCGDVVPIEEVYIDHKGVKFCRACYKGTFEDLEQEEDNEDD